MKIGQALANRPDLVGSSCADELRLLQDSMEPFPTSMARETIAKELSAADAELILAALPDTPVAAASIGQVYKVILANGTALAVKVQRPDAAALVEDDRAVAISVAGWLETLRAPSGERLLQPAIVSSVDEFFSRLKEEMDYRQELDNLRAFDSLYGRGGSAARTLRRQGGGEIITPSPWPQLGPHTYAYACTCTHTHTQVRSSRLRRGRS